MADIFVLKKVSPKKSPPRPESYRGEAFRKKLEKKCRKDI